MPSDGKSPHDLRPGGLRKKLSKNKKIIKRETYIMFYLLWYPGRSMGHCHTQDCNQYKNLHSHHQ